MISRNELYEKLRQKTGRMTLIAGPPMLDNKELAAETAEQLTTLCSRLDISLIFKAAYKRVNSTMAEEFSGLGAEPALKHLKQLGKTFQVPVQTDVYNELDVFIAARYADVLQIPAFLFRDTSLLEASAGTGKIVNIRKGLTIRGSEMSEAVQKIRRKGGSAVFLTERGTMHGYDDVVVDFRNIVTMSRNNVPLFLDLSNGIPETTGPVSEQAMLNTAFQLAKGALAAGADGIMITAHAHPAMATASEGYCYPVSILEPILEGLASFKQLLNRDEAMQ
ncbi:MAG: hypothetical protein R6V49_00670 [Bacteroidales bacterium]